MPRIFKRFTSPDADPYVFQEVTELVVEDEEPCEPLPPLPDLSEFEAEANAAPPEPPAEPEREPNPDTEPVEYAQVQARAILRDARREVEEMHQKALHELEDELDELRREAREEGFQQGLAEGRAEGHAQAKSEIDAMVKQQLEEVRVFLETAAHTRDRILDESREEIKDLALAVAEKVIRVSLKSSGDILLRMIEAATDKHKRCEWAQIYLSDCDIKAMAYTIPELVSALQPIARRIRIIPMAGDDSGNCIIELPDMIIDASVSTQMSNIRELLDNTALDKEGF